MPPFSVLMSVYKHEKPSLLDRALQSCVEQTLCPSEIVLIQDGPLTDGLNDVVRKWKILLGNTLNPIDLPQNVGLGAALNKGLEYCTYEYLARMDSDDICYPERFSQQIEYIKKNKHIQVVGGYISEFQKDEEMISGIRRVPLDHSDIAKRVRFRSPMNHVTVIFRKSLVKAVGGYRIPWPGRDHDLWLKLVHYGAIFANIPELLVKVRTGGEQLSRRGGWPFYRGEMKLHYDFYQNGLINRCELIRNILVRTGVRLLPIFLLKQFYRINRKYFS
jgi:glycosyltransferase involved in cell wall biosynthesis